MLAFELVDHCHGSIYLLIGTLAVNKGKKASDLDHVSLDRLKEITRSGNDSAVFAVCEINGCQGIDKALALVVQNLRKDLEKRSSNLFGQLGDNVPCEVDLAI